MNLNKIKKFTFRFLLGIIMLAVTIAWLLPIGWLLGTSVKPVSKAYALPPSFFPTQLNLDNYKRALITVPFGKYIFNSLFVAIASIIGMIILSSMAAYSFARIDFKYKKILFPVMLIGMMIPAQTLIIPKFLIIRSLHLWDTYWALILPGFYYPLGFFLLRQFMATIPKSYDESARIDGASKLTILFRIILPLSKSTIAVTCIMAFLASWNDFFNALIFINNTDLMTLPLGIKALNGSFYTDISLVLSGIVLSLIVPVLIYIVGQKSLLSNGVILSGVKS